MSGLLEVLAWHAADAERAEAGGADRVHLLAGTEDDPRSPEPALVGQVRRATSLPIRVMLRLREGFGTDGGELVRLQGLLSAYRQVGADGMVLGFLNAHTEIDVSVVTALIGDADFGWTFDRAVDACISVDRAWRELRRLPGLDAVLTAGSPRGVTEGLDDLVNRARWAGRCRPSLAYHVVDQGPPGSDQARVDVGLGRPERAHRRADLEGPHAGAGQPWHVLSQQAAAGHDHRPGEVVGPRPLDQVVQALGDSAG